MKPRLLALFVTFGGCVAAEDEPASTEPEPEACAGEPELEVGTGYQEFVSLEEGDSILIEAGSQGGYHITTAIRLCALEAEKLAIHLVIVEPESGLTFSDLWFERSPRSDGACCSRVDTIPGYLSLPEELAYEASNPAEWLDGKRIEIAADIEVDGPISDAIELIAER